MSRISDTAYGVIPILQTDPWRYLLIWHQKGHWGFPKGHKDGQETDQETALRELQEETGLGCLTLLPDVQFYEHYEFVNPQGMTVTKTVLYFVAFVPTPPPTMTLQVSEVQAAQWCSYPEALQKLSFDAGRQMLRQCQEQLSIRPA